jgi:hypothetical protein
MSFIINILTWGGATIATTAGLAGVVSCDQLTIFTFKI